MTLLTAIKEFFLAQGTDRKYIIGFSGGLDSTVLLALCARASAYLPLKLHAIHINHGLSTHAPYWAAHCERICLQHAIDCTVCEVNVCETSGSLEDNARKVRYDVFARHLKSHDMLLTAHHQNDQAETLLLQLLRGAGPKGLAAMATQKEFGHAQHGRPLLNFTRKELLDYAIANHLVWIDDESNQNLQYSRNLIRHQILPTLVRHFPHAIKTLARSAAHAAEIQYLTDHFGREELNSVRGSKKGTLSIAKLKRLSAPLQRLLLRAWISEQGLLLPSSKKLSAMQMQMLTAARDKNPLVDWGKNCVRRYRDNLYLLPLDNDDLLATILSQQYHWSLQERMHLPGLGCLHAERVENGGLRADIQSVTVRFRCGGETINLPKRGHRTLKSLMQEWGVLPWLRPKIPLIYHDQVLIAVVGYFIHPDFGVKKGDEGNLIAMQRFP